MAPDEQPQTGEGTLPPGRAHPNNPISALYGLLSDTSFALFVIIALALASVLGIIIGDQIPFRGEMARMRYPDRTGEPLVWLLINVIPEHPFGSVLYRTLLALLSLSLFACVIKRWRAHWRQALTIADPLAGAFDGPQALAWRTAAQPAAAAVAGFLRGRWFALRRGEQDAAWFLAGSRFGIARLGSVLSHVGFLLLVVGGLVIASSGTSGIAWLSAGESAWIPGTDAHIELADFRIETAPDGQVADYVSSVRLVRDGMVLRSAEIEVNKPLRYRGRSVYQSSYRADPTRLRSATLVYDLSAAGPAAQREAAPAAETAQSAAAPTAETARSGAAPAAEAVQPPDRMAMMQRGHEAMRRDFGNPVGVLLHPGERVMLEGTPYSAEIDTFLADFRIDAGAFRLGSMEPRNPAVRVRFYEGDTPAGSSWYFLFHPEMPVGTGPDLPVRFTDYEPFLQTGLEIATHPGSTWVWAGFAVMTIGIMLSFLLRHERLWVRARPTGDSAAPWELAVVHAGAPPRDPALVAQPWEAATTGLAAQMLRRWPPRDGRPARWPKRDQQDLGRGSDAGDEPQQGVRKP
jgi:cytochrome c biogenesis protein ResB